MTNLPDLPKDDDPHDPMLPNLLASIPGLLWLSAAIAALLLAGCTSLSPAPAQAVCDALRPALPTWSAQDTEQSKQEAAQFLDVWEAVCNGN